MSDHDGRCRREHLDVPRRDARQQDVALVQFIDKTLRHRAVRIQHDGEPAIKALVSYVQIKRQHDAQDRCTPASSSGSNGLVESPIKQIQSQCRTMRLSLEGRYKISVDSEHVWPWLVRHSAWTPNRYQPSHGVPPKRLARPLRPIAVGGGVGEAPRTPAPGTPRAPAASAPSAAAPVAPRLPVVRPATRMPGAAASSSSSSREPGASPGGNRAGEESGQEAVAKRRATIAEPQVEESPKREAPAADGDEETVGETSTSTRFVGALAVVDGGLTFGQTLKSRDVRT